MLEEIASGKIADGAIKGIGKLFTAIDNNKIFLAVYEDSLEAYKRKYGEDDLYNKFFIDGAERKDYIKKQLSKDSLSRETVINIVKYILEECDSSEEHVEFFIQILFSGLLQMEEFHHRMVSLRSDCESGEINAAVRGIDKKSDRMLEILEGGSSGSKQDEKKITWIKSSQKELYKQKWNGVLFLHRGEAKDTQLRLRDVYILPDYEFKNRKCNDLYDEIEHFIHIQKDYRVLFIMGQAGLGKSSVVSYLASKENDYVYIQFSDLGSIGDILGSVFVYLACSDIALENKTLILDGFDEAKINADTNDIINQFLDGIWEIDGLKAIITSRLHYFETDYSNMMVLQEFDENKIIRFNEVYNEKTDNSIKLAINDIDIEVYGIPLILYMIHALNINIEEVKGRNELYNRIFSLDGGIYVKCRTEGNGYGDDNFHPITGKHQRQLHKIAQKIAFAMFEKDTLEMEKGAYEEIVNEVSKDRLKDFGIANYYDIGNKLTFAHKSIYEYFVADYIFQEISQAYKNRSENGLESKLGELLKSNKLSEEITDFLSYKMKNNHEIMEDSNFFKATFDNMISQGMTYFTGKFYKNIMLCEENVFFNMLQIIHMWDYSAKELIEFNDKRSFNILLLHMHCSSLDLGKIDLSFFRLSNTYLFLANLFGANLSRANLSGADLSVADLSYADLSEADLSNANLSGAKLSDADLTGVILRGASLSGAKLLGADLSEADLSKADLKRADLSNADLSFADLSDADLRGVILTGADLNNVDLSNADLSDAELSIADLSDEELSTADLFNTIFDERNIHYIKQNYSDQVNRVRLRLDQREIVSYEEYKRRIDNKK